MVVPFFGCNDYMIIFCCSPGQVRWLCSSLWTGGPLLGCGIFFYPPTDLNLLGRRRRRRTDGVCMCRVPSGVSSCICVIVCCVCECPSDWLSVTPEEKNRIFPLHRTFFFDIFFFPPYFSCEIFWNGPNFLRLEKPVLCDFVLWNFGEQVAKKNVSDFVPFWIISTFDVVVLTHTHTHDPGVNGKQSIGEGVLVGPTCICGGVHPPPFSSDWPPPLRRPIRGWRNQLLLP